MDGVEISVIVIVYNVAPYLRQSLDSILSQSFEDMEIVIVESESTDGSAEIVDEYQRKFPKKIVAVHTPLQGIGFARNVGVSMSKGRYIGFVDSDDWIERDMFLQLYNAAIRDGSDLVICDYWSFFEGSLKKRNILSGLTTISSNAIRKVITYNGIASYGFQDIKANAIVSGTTAVWNKLFQRDLIVNIRFDEDLVCEDYFFCMKSIIDAKKVHHLPMALYHYRIRDNSILGQLRFFKNDPFQNFESVRRSTVLLQGTNQEIIDAYFDRAVMNLFNWTIDNLHNIPEVENRDKIAKEWAGQLNRVIPDWNTRRPTKNWIGGFTIKRRIVECYHNEVIDYDFDSLIKKSRELPILIAYNITQLLQKVKST